MIQKLLFLAIVLTVSSALHNPVPMTFANSTPESLEKSGLLAEIENQAAAIKSLTANFTQIRNLSLFSTPITFSGRLAVERPDRLRWEFLQPLPSVLIFNKKTGQRCSPGSDPVKFNLHNDPIMRMVAEQLWTWLKGDYGALEKDYSIEYLGNSTLRLSPKIESTANVISAITITFEKINRQVKKVIINEPEGDKTVITFSEYRLNDTLSPSLFITCFGLD